MPASEEKLSPEEKLLKVIQGGDEEKGESEAPATTAPAGLSAPAVAAEPGLATPSEGVAATAPATAATVVDDEAPAAAAVVSEGTPQEPAPAAAPAAPPAPPVARHAPSSRQLGIRAVNKCLAAVVVILILFAVLEIWANIQSAAAAAAVAPLREDAPLDLGAAGAETDLPDIKIVLQEWTKNPIVGIPAVSAKAAPQPEQAMAKRPWRKYVEENLNLIGLSVVESAAGGEREAIIVDVKKDKMLFLKAGDKIMADDRELELMSIQSDSVKLTDGKEEMLVK